MSRFSFMPALALLCVLPFAGSCGRREPAPTLDAAWYPEQILSPDERRAEAELKTARIAAFLRRENLAGVLLSTAPNFAWATAGGDNISSDGTLPAAIFVRDDGRRYLITGSLQAERIAREEIDGSGCEVRSIPTRLDDERIGEEAREAAGGRAYGSDAPFPGARIIERELATLRIPLTESEIREYRWLGKRCAEVVGDTCRRIEPGMTERGIEALLSAGLMRHAIRPSGLRVAADERGRNYGAVPASEKAKVQRSVLLGVTARRWGLTVRMSRQVRFGAPDPDTFRAMTAVSSANAAFWAYTLVDASARDILSAAAEACARAGYTLRPEVPGGAIGYFERDWPAGSDERVRSGQAFAWNPSAGPVSVEDTILIQGDRLEVLTEIRGWPVIESRSLGRIYRTPSILAR